MRAQSSYCIASTALLIGADDLWHGVLLYCPCWSESLLSFSFTHGRCATVWPCPAARLVSVPWRTWVTFIVPSLSLHCPFNSWSREIFKSLVNGSPSNTMVLCSAFGPCNLSCSSTSPHCNLLNLLFGTCSWLMNLWTIRKATKITK